MNVVRFFFPVLILVACASLAPAYAEESPLDPLPQLSLSDAVARALLNSPSLGAEQARVSGSRERQKAAQAEYRPQASFQLNATEFQNPMIVTPIHGFTPGAVPLFDSTLIQGSLNMEMLLYDGKARQAAVRQTKAQSTAAASALGDARSRVIAETVAAYLSLLASGEILEAQDVRLEALRLEQARIRDFYAVGRVAEVEVLRLDAAVALAEAERALLATTLENAGRDLARMLGTGEERIRGEMLRHQALQAEDPPERDALLVLARAGNRQIQQAEKRLEAAGLGVTLARSSKKPKLRAFAGVTEYGSAEFDFTTEWAAGLRFSVPLYTGGRSAHRIAQAGAAQKEAEQELRALKRRIASLVDHALGAWQAGVEREKSLATAVRGFEAVAASERLRLETGTGIPADFLDAEADLLKARASRVIAANAVVLSRVELAGVLGELDEGWIARHLAEAPSGD
jgi:outer membrane protein